MRDIAEPLYRYLVKNLRGIVYFSREVCPKTEFDWLKRKFRYRELGISENLQLNLKWKKLLRLPKIDDNPALDSLLQASNFICPLIVLKEQSLKDFGNAIVAVLKTLESLNDKDLKFNLRLVNYSITDFYLKSIEFAKRSDMESRKRLAERDLKRFWRVKADTNGKTLIAYIDPLLIKSDINNPTYMSLVPCLVIDFNGPLNRADFSGSR
ncbi:hypothetical protein KEJ24_05655 [Candidatus Bathyarchaeota archaeon]|nr:hypothetical protein [Candidatus Bathyarchaeota archaeon]